MMRGLLVLLMLLAAAVGGASLMPRFNANLSLEGGDPVRHRSTVPKIEQVRALASLVTLDVPITDLHISELDGFTGGVKMIVSVRGDVQIMTDMSEARFDDIDAERQEAVLVLPRPEPKRPRIDHDKTRIVELRRTGLWRIVPGDGGERVLTNRAMTAAQQVVGEAARDEQLVAQACAQAERVIGGFFEALDWSVVVRWDEGGESDVQQAQAEAAGPATAAAR